MRQSYFRRDMLVLARTARGLTQAELASASNVTQALISKLENGLVTTPSEDVVEALAGAVRFPVAFFFEQADIYGLPHFHYRKRMKLPAKALSRIEASINIKRQHITKLLRSYEVRSAKPIPMLDLDNERTTPTEIARRMREYWMLPRGPISNVVEVIENAGGIIIPARFDTGDLDAISFRAPGLPPLFFANRDMPGDRSRFSLAHELGHMIMHSIPDEDDRMEAQADEFAAAFLMPPSEIKSYIAYPSLGKLGRAKEYWGVSLKALIKRAFDLKLITPQQYKGLNVNYSKAGYTRNEPHPMEREQPKLLAEMIRYHMSGLNYTSEQLADFLLLNLDDFKKMYAPETGIRLIVSN
jgi:Zn-dependent peptidase ImmA (M78 family)